jgi:hypothetical protein
MASPCSTNCAPRASWAFRPLRCGGWARKTTPCGTSGTSPAPESLQALAPCSRATISTSRAKATSCASPACPAGKRTVTVDTTSPIRARSSSWTSTWMCIPRTYTVEYYGYHPNEVRDLFRRWTRSQVDAEDSRHSETEERQRHLHADRRGGAENIGLMQRVVREGNEIGNHTYTHPDISEISPRQLDLQVNLTERLFASKLGVQPLYFRPPYDIDEEPETDDQAAPVCPSRRGLHPSSATRSTPTTGTSIRARRPQEITNPCWPVADHEDQAAVPRLHHPDARRRRRPLRYGGRAAGADRRAARARLHDRAGLGADGQDHRRGDAQAHLLAVLRALPDSVAFSGVQLSATSSSWSSLSATF